MYQALNTLVLSWSGHKAIAVKSSEIISHVTHYIHTILSYEELHITPLSP